MRRSVFLSLFLVTFSSVLFAEDEKKSTDGNASKQEKITYVDHVLPIFRARCGSCHNANDRRGGLVLDQYATMMEGGSSGVVVDPGSAEFSYLWMLVNHEDSPTMPPESDKLPDDELALIRSWIDAGALENSSSIANVEKKPSLTKIEVSSKRPATIAVPQSYLGDPQHNPSSVNAVTALACSPWAPILAVSGYQQVALYNSSTLEPLGVLPFPEGQPQVIKFSRNGALLIVGGGRGGQMGTVGVFDVETGERKVQAGDEYDEVLAADMSPDQSLIALGGPKRMLRVYSTDTSELVYEQKKHTDWITAIEFSPDGVLLASGDRSNGLIVWEAETGNLFYDLPGHKGSVTDVTWRADSNLLASASEDGTIKLWDVQTGENVKSWNAHSGGVLAADFTRDGNLVSVGRDRRAGLWKADGSKLKDFPGLADIGMEVAFDAESNRVIAGGWDGMIHLWNAADAKQVGQIDTNPPTAASYLAKLQPQLANARTSHANSAKALAEITRKLAARQTAANEAVASAQQANQSAQLLKDQFAKSSTELKSLNQALTETAKPLAQALEKLRQAHDKQMQAQDKFASAKESLDQQSAKMAQLDAAVKASQEGVKKAKETSELLRSAAEPTVREKSLIENNPEVKAAVEKRGELAKAAQASVTFTEIVASQTSEQWSAGQSSIKVLTDNFHAAQFAFETAREKTQQAKQSHEQCVQSHAALQQKVETLQKSIAELKTKLEQSLALAKTSQAKADKLAAAAKPSEAEQKALKDAQSQTAADQAELKRLQRLIERFQSYQDQLAAASGSAN